MTPISTLVEAHVDLFAGAARSTPEALRRLEQSLNVTLPVDVFWFMSACGAADTDAVSNERAMVLDTLRYREAVGLPSRLLVLHDRNDAGTVFLDTSSAAGAVTWVDAHAVAAFASGTIQAAQCDAYPSFYEWVADCIRERGA